MLKLKKFVTLLLAVIISTFGFACVDTPVNPTFTVKYMLKGEEISTVTVEENAKVQAPTEYTLAENERLDGWYADEAFTTEAWDFENNTVTANTTLYAKVIASFTVSYYINGQEVSTVTVDEGEKVTAPETNESAPGYTFNGWYTDEALTTVYDFENNVVTANISLYAAMVEAPYDIKLVTGSTLVVNTDENIDADYQLMGYTDSLVVNEYYGGNDYSYQVSASIQEVENATFAYASSDTSVVTVNESGLVEFVKAGKAFIYVTCTDGLAKVAVTVFSEIGYKNFFEGEDNNWKVIAESHNRSDLADCVPENNETYRSYIGNKVNGNFQFDPFTSYTNETVRWIDIELKVAANFAMARFFLESDAHITPKVRVYGYNKEDKSDLTLLAEDNSASATAITIPYDGQENFGVGTYQLVASGVLTSTATYKYLHVEFEGDGTWWKPSIRYMEIYTA